MRRHHPRLPSGHSKADLHIHTTFSDGTVEPEDLLNYYSVFPDLRVIAVTDHDTIDGALRVAEHRQRHLDVYEGIEVIVGEEITAREGHVLGLFLEEWVPPDLPASETVERIHAQGGLAIAAHPYTHLLQATGLRGVGELIHRLPFDAVETRNANITEIWSNLWASWRSRRMAQVGASDAHFLRAVGCCYTIFPGSSAADLRLALERRLTRPAGRCYGLPTLFCYLLDQLRAGQSLVPNRRRAHHAPAGSDLRIEARAVHERDTMWLQCAGRLDARAGLALKSKATSILEAGMHLVLDLRDITWLDSAGMTALIAAHKCAERCKLALLINDPSTIVLEALRAARLHRALHLAKSEVQAWEQIQAVRDMRLAEQPSRRDGKRPKTGAGTQRRVA